MKNKLRKIIIWLYWKTNCHMQEPFSRQLMLYSMPGKFTKKDALLLAFQIKHNQDRAFIDFEPIAACSFPDKEIDVYKDIDIKELNK